MSIKTSSQAAEMRRFEEGGEDIKASFELGPKLDKSPSSIATVVRQFVESLTLVSPQEEAIRKQRFFDQIVNTFSESSISFETDKGEKIAKIFRIDYANPDKPKVVVFIPNPHSRSTTLDGDLTSMSVYHLMNAHPHFLTNFLSQFNAENPIALRDPEDSSKTVRGFILETTMDNEVPMLKILMNGQERMMSGIEFVKLQPAVIGG